MIITIDTEKANLTAKQIRQIHEIIGSSLTNCCKCAHYYGPGGVIAVDDVRKNICAKCHKPIKLLEKPKSPPIELLDDTIAKERVLAGEATMADNNRLKINKIIKALGLDKEEK